MIKGSLATVNYSCCLYCPQNNLLPEWIAFQRTSTHSWSLASLILAADCTILWTNWEGPLVPIVRSLQLQYPLQISLFTRVGQSLFRYFQKDRQGAIWLLFTKRANRSFKKSNKERITLLKRATKSKLLFRSLQKERFALLLFTNRAKEQKKSESLLFCVT